jgi:allophanate hydrolase subunit 1
MGHELSSVAETVYVVVVVGFASGLAMLGSLSPADGDQE